MAVIWGVFAALIFAIDTAAAWEEINGPIIAFARLIAEKQREEDASICDGLKHFFGYQCAAAIRKGGAA
jgi:hypothetical protein